LTTSEALALSCPLLLTRPIPGQEEGNTRVLCAAGAAVEATDPTAVTREVERIFRNPDRLNDLSASARAMGRPHAAADIMGTVDREYFSRAVA
jgi:processive 1,2-diacylglycerol beta-glucosyltransferase